MASIVDIHPHVIATDTARYPLDPLGGTQSGWSRERPTTYAMLVAAMDAAGVDKAAIVQASTAYGYDNTYVAEAVAAHPKRFTGVFSVDVLAPDAAAKMQYWMQRGLTGLAPVHHRQHHAGPGDLVRRQAHLPGLGVCRRGGAAGLHADDAAGLSAAARAHAPVPQGADHPRPPGAAAARGRPALCGGSRLLRLRGQSERVPEGDAAQLHARRLGQGHAGELLRQAGRRVRGTSAWPGAQIFPRPPAR